MPEAWVDRLSELQDALPARRFCDVEQSLKDAFPGRWPFQSVDEMPLATASIAQVHKARLLDGQQVVVKVQHRGIEDLIIQDLENAMYLAGWLAKEKPEHDYRELLQEWCDETRKETDFQHEAYNLERVASNLKSLSGVRLPKLIRHVKDVGKITPTREVLVMEYIDGVKPTDTKSIREIGVDGDLLMERISAAFAHQIFVDGLFNGDPHPGNMLVERSTRMPILLDFGFVKEVPEKIRIAFCRLLVSAAEQDFVGLLAAMRDMGLGEQVSLARPKEAMNFVRYAFRDATPTAEQQKRSSSIPDEFEDEDWDLIEEEAAGAFRSGSQDGSIIPSKQQNSIPVIAGDGKRPAQNQGYPQMHTDSNDTDQNQAYSEGLAEADQDVSMNGTGETQRCKDDSVKPTPGTVLFLLRVVGCLRGIAVSVGVPHSYLKTMAPFARQALRAACAAQSIPRAVPKNSTEAALIQKAVDLKEKGLLVGIQMCVFHGGQMVANVAVGEMGSMDPRPLRTNALFNAFSCGKAVAALLIHVMCDKGWIESIDDQVCKYWPSFGANGKQNISIRQLLEHTAGLGNVMPRRLAEKGPGAAIRALCDFNKMTQWIASAQPRSSEIGTESYHALTQGWLVGGLAEQVAQRALKNKRCDYASLVKDLILYPLGILGEVHVRIPSDGKGSGQISEEFMDRLASISLHPKELAADGDLLGSLGGQQNKSEGLMSLGMDPRAFNDPVVRQGTIPAVNTHFSARGLATIYAALGAEGNLQGKGRVLSIPYVRKIQQEVASVGHQKTWPLGFRRFRVLPKGGEPMPRAFGFAGLYNNMAYCDPGEDLAVALIVNQLDYDATASKDMLCTLSAALEVAPHSLDGLGVR
eukprot:gnl/MRDRNA2_/MRDRNA2_81254_c0_seq1.p1 gnl/MRDRNA2_/MRDRNA2_81254_c0~~gnl/MRDRNA2_/MRDRNA2_81254_c0_seq1.p1  ORF type:complete len:989 (+),score=202.81 gnl/MRDRNA2_/MRDRNA2_81254_c0_seq1:378-2969(+)